MESNSNPGWPLNCQSASHFRQYLSQGLQFYERRLLHVIIPVHSIAGPFADSESSIQLPCSCFALVLSRPCISGCIRYVRASKGRLFPGFNSDGGRIYDRPFPNQNIPANLLYLALEFRPSWTHAIDVSKLFLFPSTLFCYHTNQAGRFIHCFPSEHPRPTPP